jgi:glycosyltransferase involved in cell wall biosynthesis
MAAGASCTLAATEFDGDAVKVVHVPFGYFPDAVGGTEVYVAELARGLRARGVESVVAAPSTDGVAARYEHDGTMVCRFTVDTSANVADVYGEGDDAAARSIARIVDEMDADVLHLHAFTRAASLRVVRVAKRRGVAVAFTYHTPTASCVRGTLLRDGREPCDGALIAHRCTACLLQSRGVPFAVRAALSRAPAALGAAVASVGATGPVATALRARELTTMRHRSFEALLAECDAIVAVCNWVRSLVVRAGAPAERVVLSRQGTPAIPWRGTRRGSQSGPVRLAFVGRLHPTKGVHVVLRALADERDLPVALDVFGVAQDAESARYREQLEALAVGDARVQFRPALAAARVVETLAGYDATIVPSQWLETGPLTVLESFAAGVPVIGSDLGGIGELVAHDGDGWLVRHGDSDAWRAALRRIATDRALLERLRAGVRPPRTTDDVARDMVAVYDAIVPRRVKRTVAPAGVA